MNKDAPEKESCPECGTNETVECIDVFNNWFCAEGCEGTFTGRDPVKWTKYNEWLTNE